MRAVITLFLVLIPALTLAVLVTDLDAKSGTGTLLIIVNKNNTLSQLDAKDLKRIYFGKMHYWENSEKVVPCYLADDRVSQAFFDELLGQPYAAFQGYWVKRVFAGHGVPPAAMRSAAQLMEFVSAQPGAVGIITRPADLETVREVPLK